MTRYERIRQEIIAIEREIVSLRHQVKDDRARESLQRICARSDQIRHRFVGALGSREA